ncbi:interferon-inducible GTPase 5-like [Sphaerodactylus townsendi]|uniref:interferon-inducible GTPase 5-like n=1 Tax=Sphaerodactylus townsendi TaxID=933632 RepID=UPI002026159D|nr:interferon-inducible GTPase 5-like [Sphaerodactylus townsendi]
MGAAITKNMVTEELEKLQKDWENKNLPDLTKKIQEDLDLLKNTTLEIAVTGASGAGKSSLVNALRGMTDFEDGAAETGVTETTTERKSYPHPTFPNLIMWDLPGIGTPNFKAKEYVTKVNFKKYDCFIIVASDRFRDDDVLLAREIRKMNKKFYYVRTKVDISINSEGKKPNFSEEKCLEKIRKYHCDNLTQVGESNPRVFLISRDDLAMYDFPLLQASLEDELDDLKREVLILSMPAFSKEVLKKKKATMEDYIRKVAFLSCAIGAVPVPGLSVVCDLAILVGAMIHICKVFGLDEDSLNRLAKRIGKPVDVLKSAIKKSPLASQITSQFVIDMLTKSVVCGILIMVELVLDFVPVLGSITGGALSFGTTFYILKNFLHDAEKDAENVRTKAVKS